MKYKPGLTEELLREAEGAAAAGAAAEGTTEGTATTAEAATEPTEGTAAETETAAAAAAPAAAAPAAAAAPSAAADWRAKRISTLTAKLRDAEQQLAVARTAPTEGTGLDEAEVERRASVRAAELAAAAAFNDRCNATAVAGKATFGEAAFNGRIRALQEINDPSDPATARAYNTLLDVAIETGEGAKLLYELGADLDEASRIMGLPPTKMALELAKRLRVVGEAEPTLPKPIRPVGGRGAQHTEVDPSDTEKADTLTTREWMARREKQLAARRAA